MASTRCKTFFLYWVPAILYAGILFYLSSLSQSEVPRLPFSDKVIHIGLYAGFGALLVRAFRPDLKPARILVIAIGGSILYGLTDEFHQGHVKDRSSDLADLVADGVGGLVGGLTYLLGRYVQRTYGRRKVQGDDQAVAAVRSS